MPKSTKQPVALVVFASTEIVAKDDALEQLKNTAIQQAGSIARMDRNVARGGVILGLTLHRVKASLPHGEFRPFLEQMLPGVTNWSGSTCVKNASFLMRLAEIFVTKAKIGKSDILALPGDPLSLDIADQHEAKRLLEKLDAFAGYSSLNELLIKYGIKGVGLKKALEAEKAKEDAAAAAPNAEQLYFQYRDEVGGIILRAESLFLKEGALAHLVGHPEELQGVAKGLRTLADQVEKQVAALITKSNDGAIPTAEDVP